MHEQRCYTVQWDCQVTRKTATEEDRGEDNKDPDWLIEQSTARQVDVTLRNVEKVDKSVAVILAKSRIKFYFLQRLRQQQKFRDKLLSRYVTLGNFWVQLASPQNCP